MDKKKRLVVEGSAAIIIGIVLLLTVEREIGFYLPVGMWIGGMVCFYRAHKMEAE